MNKLISVSLLTLLTSCATTQHKPPTPGTYEFSIKVVETQQEVEKYCGKGKNGCGWLFGEKLHIYSIPDWCVIYHEVQHGIEKDFHKKPATCDVRAKY